MWLDEWYILGTNFIDIITFTNSWCYCHCSGSTCLQRHSSSLGWKVCVTNEIYAPNGYVAIIVDEYVTGFNLMFKEKKIKIKYWSSQLVMDCYESHCFHITSSTKLERIWSFINFWEHLLTLGWIV